MSEYGGVAIEDRPGGKIRWRRILSRDYVLETFDYQFSKIHCSRGVSFIRRGYTWRVVGLLILVIHVGFVVRTMSLRTEFKS